MDIDKLEEAMRNIEEVVGCHKITQVELHHRLLTLENRFLSLEADVIKTRELILSKLNELSMQIHEIQTNRMIEEDREKQNKLAGSVMNTVINTAINAFMLVIALKVAGVL